MHSSMSEDSSLKKLKENQCKFRKENRHNSKAILDREEEDKEETIRLLHLDAGNSVPKLMDYYREWYSKDSTAENVVATVIHKQLLEKSSPLSKYFGSNHRPYKLYFGTSLLNELKHLIQTSNQGLNFIPDIERELATPITKLLEQYEQKTLLERAGLFNIWGKANVAPSCLKDGVAIFAFLFDDDRFFAQLDIIEKRLRDEAIKMKVLNPTDNSLLGYQEGKIFKHNKLLFGCLRQLAEECGYVGYARIYDKDLSSKDFSSLLTGGTPFKDTGVRGPQHGEEGHLLQLICLGLEYNKPGNKFLSKHPTQFFVEVHASKEENSLTYFWNSNFELAFPIADERYNTLIPSSIGRSVFKLHEYLTHPKSRDRYPLLHQLIKSRDFKPGLSEKKIQEIGSSFTVEFFAQKSTTVKPENSSAVSTLTQKP